MQGVLPHPRGARTLSAPPYLLRAVHHLRRDRGVGSGAKGVAWPRRLGMLAGAAGRPRRLGAAGALAAAAGAAGAIIRVPVAQPPVQGTSLKPGFQRCRALGSAAHASFQHTERQVHSRHTASQTCLEVLGVGGVHLLRRAAATGSGGGIASNASAGTNSSLSQLLSAQRWPQRSDNNLPWHSASQHKMSDRLCLLPSHDLPSCGCCAPIGKSCVWESANRGSAPAAAAALLRATRPSRQAQSPSMDAPSRPPPPPAPDAGGDAPKAAIAASSPTAAAARAIVGSPVHVLDCIQLDGHAACAAGCADAATACLHDWAEHSYFSLFRCDTRSVGSSACRFTSARRQYIMPGGGDVHLECLRDALRCYRHCTLLHSVR